MLRYQRLESPVSKLVSKGTCVQRSSNERIKRIRRHRRIGKDLDRGLASFFTSFLCARPVALPISKPVARKNRLRLPNTNRAAFHEPWPRIHAATCESMMNPAEAGNPRAAESSIPSDFQTRYTFARHCFVKLFRRLLTLYSPIILCVFSA